MSVNAAEKNIDFMNDILKKDYRLLRHIKYSENYDKIAITSLNISLKSFLYLNN